MTILFPDTSLADSYLSAAEEAFQTYRKTSGRDRATFLRTIATELENLGDVLIETASRESRLPVARITGERGRTVSQLRMFADLLDEGSWVDAHIDTALPDRTPIPKPDIRKMLIPLGPVVVFGASNFPLAFSTAGGDTASALAAGCSVIVKAHPAHPDTSTLVAQAISRAVGTSGLPAATFQHAVGDIPLGQALVAHPLTRAIGFTGSLHAGKSLFDIASRRKEPIPVFAEMGSVNPTVILPEALRYNARSIATTMAGSITLGVGQFCTNPGLLLAIDTPDLDAFIGTLSKSISEVAPTPMLTEGIAGHYNRNLSKLIDAQGVEIVATASTEMQPNLGTATVAKVSAAHFMTNPALAEEVFGPFSLLVTCRDQDELLMAIDSLSGQLTASIWASETELTQQPKLFEALMARVGRLIINGAPTGVEVCPSMHHGGPFPATTDSRSTSVGTDAIKRFVRPLAFQNVPQSMLPAELHGHNPLGILRLVNGSYTREPISS
jgi:alpha-ketoglutaric semialdehyde dehydrogenase